MKIRLTMPWYLFLIVFALSVYGWCLNIAIIWNGSFTPLTGEMVLRVIGIFVGPLGAILGYV